MRDRKGWVSPHLTPVPRIAHATTPPPHQAQDTTSLDIAAPHVPAPPLALPLIWFLVKLGTHLLPRLIIQT